MKNHDQSTHNAVSLSYLLIETEAFEYQQNALARVFSNGTQKCVVLITLQARDVNGIVVPIPDDLNVNAVPYTSASGGWASTMTPPPTGIQSFPEHLLTPADTEHSEKLPAEPRADFQQFRRYISYTNIPEGTTHQFAAQVKIGNTTYTSNQRDVPYGGAGENGRYNSSFRLRSVQPPQYATHNGGLQISAPREVFSGTIDSYTTKVMNTYASLRYPGTSHAINIRPGSTGADSSLHENKATAFGDAGSGVAKKNVPTNSRVGLALNQALSTIREPVAGSVAVAVAMFGRGLDQFPPRQTSHYSDAMDVYGNPLRLSVTLTSIDAHRQPFDYQLRIEWAGN